MFENLRADFKRNREIYYQDKTFVRQYVSIYFQFGSLAVIVYRFGRWAQKLPIVGFFLMPIYVIAKLFVLILSGVDIILRTDIGKGLIIHNFQGIFINADYIGENCTINQGVTVGAIRERGAKRPTIGDNAYMGAGCKIFGGITVGNNVTIASNSLVVSAVSDNATVMGVPARVVSLSIKEEEKSIPKG